MEAINALIALCPQAAVPIVICVCLCWALYLKIGKDRKTTKTERDADSEQMKTRIALLENEVNRLKDLDLESKLAQILTDLAWLKDRMK